MNKTVRNLFIGAIVMTSSVLTLKILNKKNKNLKEKESERKYIYLYNSNDIATKEDINELREEINIKVKKIS